MIVKGVIHLMFLAHHLIHNHRVIIREKKQMLEIFSEDPPEEESDETGIAKKQLEDCGDSNRSLDFPHSHL